MKDIIIVCAGTYGREVFSVIEKINADSIKSCGEKKYNILGFIDDNLHALDGTGVKSSIIGKISDWQPKDSEVYAIGAAFPSMKVKIVEFLKAKGCRFETLVAPWSIVSDDCVIGEGCFISANCVSAAVKIGNFVNINGSTVCPGATIDDFSTVTGFAVVEAARIGKRVFVGSHAVIQSGIEIGDDAQISVGSIVTKAVDAGKTVFGVPAVTIN